MKSILLICLFVIFSATGIAQVNLVPNPSFEDTVYCPFYFNQMDRSQYWSSYGGSPDYYNSCNSGHVGIPFNDVGYQFAKSGNAYAGFYSYARFASSDREQLGIQLIQPLQIGVKYYVSFYLALAVGQINHNNIASNKIGVKFLTQPYSAVNPIAIDNYSQIVTDSIISDSIAWTEIKGSFIPDSSFLFMSVGNFYVDSLTETIIYDSIAAFSYYYIDDIVVSTDSLLSYILPTPINQPSVNIFFSSEEDCIIIQGSNLKNYSLYDIFGREYSLETSITSDEIKIKNVNLKQGIYFVSVRFDSHIAIKKIIIY